jgi:hypothetical protein
MDTKHTPGPWEVQVFDGRIEVVDASGAVVLVFRNASAETLANARLIAAAPELLEALRDVLRIAKAASIGVTGNAKRIERAESAIAKATGGAK